MHSLDNPFWNAMVGPQCALSTGDERARRYLPGVATQAGVAANDDAAFEALATLVDEGESVDVFWTDVRPGASGLQRAFEDELVQMVATRPNGVAPVPCVELGEADLPDMLELTAATRPGPFLSGALSLGRFLGIREDGRLVAMAGERAHLEGYREITAVCTRPSHRRRGYGRALVHALATRRVEQGETPFLHVPARNRAAIALYRGLGFEPRRHLRVTVLRRPRRDA